MTTPPGTSLEMLHAIGGLLAAEGPVEIGTMFRSPGLRTGTKIFAFLGTRTLREWVEIPAHASPDTTLDTWTALATEALHYVRSLNS